MYVLYVCMYMKRFGEGVDIWGRKCSVYVLCAKRGLKIYPFFSFFWGGGEGILILNFFPRGVYNLKGIFDLVSSRFVSFRLVPFRFHSFF